MELSLKQLRNAAGAKGMTLDPEIVMAAQLLVFPTHGVIDFKQKCLNLHITVPLYSEADRMKLYQYFPTPLYVEVEGQTWYSIVKPEKTIIAMKDADRIELTPEELASQCTLLHGKSYCSFPVSYYPKKETCLFQLFNEIGRAHV